LHKANKQLKQDSHILDGFIKKRERCVKTSTLTQQRVKVKTVLSIIAEETVVVKADQALNIFFLNISAEFNVISQCFTVANEMVKLNAKILHFLLLSNHFVYCYEAYLMKY